VFLYHYFDETIGPFVNLSDIAIDEAKAVLDSIKKQKPNVQCARRQASYMEDRYYYEDIIRTEFAKKGGIIKKKSPHYMVVEQSPWLNTWFYTYDEILLLIEKYGLPQVWNNDGAYGPERYIEAHIWSDETIGKYRAEWWASR
jgi:hypothetical protein